MQTAEENGSPHKLLTHQPPPIPSVEESTVPILAIPSLGSQEWKQVVLDSERLPKKKKLLRAIFP